MLAFCSVQAGAADLGPYPRGGSIKDAPAPVYAAPAFNWNGFHAGAQIGYGWGTTDADSRSLGGLLAQSYSYDNEGFLGGLHAGFNWQTGPLLLGVESDIELSGVEGSGTGSLGAGHTTNLDWLGSLRGRIGLPSGNTLFYLTGGLAYGNAEIQSAALSYSEWRTGWTLGGGIEQAFTPNVTARLEYRYTDLGSWESESAGALDRTDLTLNTLRAGLSFKF